MIPRSRKFLSLSMKKSSKNDFFYSSSTVKFGKSILALP